MFREQVMAVINLAVLLGVDEALTPAVLAAKQIVVLRDSADSERMGLLVDHLGEIPEIPLARIETLSSLFGADDQLADSMVKKSTDEPNSDLLVLLSAERIRQRITKQGVIARIDQEYEPGMA
jgi:chemotaxis signal transduction protein